MAIAQRTPVKGEGAACRVILKQVQMPPEDERRQRAVEEVQLATRLHHPGIAEVYGREEHEGTPYVVLEHSPGIFLATVMETALLLGRTLAPSHAVYIAAEVADALHYAWNSQGEDGRPLHLVHRAVSPTSIRLELSGRVTLTDFGVAYSRTDPLPEQLPRGLHDSPAWVPLPIARSSRSSRPGALNSGKLGRSALPQSRGVGNPAPSHEQRPPSLWGFVH